MIVAAWVQSHILNHYADPSPDSSAGRHGKNGNEQPRAGLKRLLSTARAAGRRELVCGSGTKMMDQTEEERSELNLRRREGLQMLSKREEAPGLENDRTKKPEGKTP